MAVFLSTINQMGFLMLLIIIGYILSKLKLLPDNSSAVLSKLENNVFIPALVLGTFINNFTIEKINVAWQYILIGTVTIFISIPIAIAVSKLATKDSYIEKIYTYGLAFSNFGFMGNAVVKTLFPEIFMEYLIFVLPFWIMIFLWGVPNLLIPTEGHKTIKSRLSALVNPMFVAMLIGIIIGIFNIPMPEFLNSSVTTLGDCMSPIAMLLTGITIAKIDLKTTFKNVTVYLISIIRLLVIPIITIFAILLISNNLISVPHGIALCTVCSVAMPLGLNTIVIPAGYGKDTSIASGMALISHLMSCFTIPIVFMIFENIIK